MKIYLSGDTIELLKKHDLDIAAAGSDIEAELMEKAREQLSMPKENGKYNLSRDVFDYIMAALDWYVGAYYQELARSAQED